VADALGNSVGAIESVVWVFPVFDGWMPCGGLRSGAADHARLRSKPPSSRGRVPKAIANGLGKGRGLQGNNDMPPSFGRVSARFGAAVEDSYLVDSASSHMLVSKIKPCMSKYSIYTVKLRMAH
jgi:hypothetical protein